MFFLCGLLLPVLNYIPDHFNLKTHDPELKNEQLEVNFSNNCVK